MKIRAFLTLVLTLIAATLPSSSHAADDRVFYYSKQDVVDPPNVNAHFDVRNVQAALTSTGYLQFYVVLTLTDSNKLTDTAYVGVMINTDGQTGSEYIFTTAQINYYGSSKSDMQVFDIRGENPSEVANCDGSSWITEKKDAVAFEILASCIKAPVGASALAFADDGTITDYSPENSDEFKFKTNYLSTKSCTAKTKDAKFIYVNTQYICNQKNGKWIWVDYAPIAASKAKYLTEKAFYSCRLNTNILGAEVSDRGKTLELDGVYKYFVSDSQFACVTAVLGMPASVKSKLSMTRALDGIQNAKFGKLSADWSYHPDDGLSITFTYN
jgi:hypothetical protein